MRTISDRPVSRPAAARRKFGLAIMLSLIAAIAAQTAPALADETLKFGMSVPLSGSGAYWGINSTWVAQQAAKQINEEGGIKAGGKTYKVEIVSYDNKYTAADGAKVAQTLINRDGIRFVILGIGTPPVAALQTLSEREGALLMTTSWATSIKGPKFPLTFTVNSTPAEFIKPLYEAVLQRHPNIKTVALVTPNDAGSRDAAKAMETAVTSLGLEIVLKLSYERGTSEFQPIATQLARTKPDAIDVGGAPAADAGALLKEIEAQGWRGVKIASAGAGAADMQKAGGAAVEGTYLGMGADYSAPTAAAVQRQLNEAAKAELGEPLDIAMISAWDAIMAVKAGIEKTDSIDPRVVAKALPELVFDSSYGPASFGGAETYGSPQQILIPIMVTEFRDGKVTEVTRIPSDELKKRLAGAQ